MSDTATRTIREFQDAEGERWVAVATDTMVAHTRIGAALAYHRAGEEAAGLLRTNITFNTMAAAEAAISAMSLKELRRRLVLARQAAGGV